MDAINAFLNRQILGSGLTVKAALVVLVIIIIVLVLFMILAGLGEGGFIRMAHVKEGEGQKIREKLDAENIPCKAFWNNNPDVKHDIIEYEISADPKTVAGRDEIRKIEKIIGKSLLDKPIPAEEVTV